MSMLPLQGTRVLDLTRHLPGPYCSLALAELGAEVIKVEQPQQGDPLRHMPWLGDRASEVLFGLVNRGKKSIALNLKASQGREVFLRLVQTADVLMEGFRPGVMKRLALDYAPLAAANPGLIYASLSGYGQTGPYQMRAGHDLNYMALGGLLGVTGTPDGTLAIPGIPVADLASALWAALGISAALFGRQRAGRGQYLDISIMESVTSLMVLPVMQWLGSGRMPQRGKLPLTGAQACYNAYRTADAGYMTLGALEPQFWRAFCLAVNREDWVARQGEEDQSALIAEVAGLFAAQPRAHWADLFARHDCCCEPVLALDEAFSHPQAMERGLLHEGQLSLPLGRHGVPHARAPELGEHTAELLGELGYTSEDLESLRQQGVL